MLVSSRAGGKSRGALPLISDAVRLIRAALASAASANSRTAVFDGGDHTHFTLISIFDPVEVAVVSTLMTWAPPPKETEAPAMFLEMLLTGGGFLSARLVGGDLKAGSLLDITS